jgi:hypothetical protein
LILHLRPREELKHVEVADATPGIRDLDLIAFGGRQGDIDLKWVAYRGSLRIGLDLQAYTGGELRGDGLRWRLSRHGAAGKEEAQE